MHTKLGPAMTFNFSKSYVSKDITKAEQEVKAKHCTHPLDFQAEGKLLVIDFNIMTCWDAFYEWELGMLFTFTVNFRYFDGLCLLL